MFKAEGLDRVQVDVKVIGASHQQDLHLVWQDVHGGGCDQ